MGAPRPQRPIVAMRSPGPCPGRARRQWVVYACWSTVTEPFCPVPASVAVMVQNPTT